MLQRPEISKEDSKALASFYREVRNASSGVPQALDRAQVELARCSNVARQVAWADVYENYAATKPSFLKQIDSYYNKHTDFLPRAMNRMIQKLGKADFEGMETRYKEPGVREVRRWAIESAMKSLLTDDKEGAKEELIAITKYATTPDDFKFLREGWLLTVEKKEDGEYKADKAHVDRLAKALFRFQHTRSRRSDVPKYIEDLRAAMGIPQAETQDEQLGACTRKEAGAKLSSIMAKDGGLRLVMDAARMRIKPYGRTVDRLMAEPAVKRLLRFIRRDMEDNEDSYARKQLAAGGVVMTPENVDAQARGHAYAKPLYELTQDVAKKLGFTKDVTVVIATSIAPNAFVYTADVDKPRVTIFTSMLQKFWDFDKNDWLALTLDADGKPVEAGSAGARDVAVGKLLTESILAHELGHIRDEAMLTRTLLIYMFLAHGQDLARKIEDPSERMQAEKCHREGLQTLLHNLCAPVFGGLAGTDGAIAPFDVERLRSQVEAALQKAQIGEGELAALAESLLVSVPGPDPAGRAGRSAFFGDVMRFIEGLLKISRAAEETADRYAVVAQGTPRWSGLVDAMLGLNIHSPGSEAEKRRAIADLIALDPELFAKRQLRELGNYGKEYTPDTEWILGNSHPVFVSRIMQDFDFAKDKEGMAVRMKKWDRLPAEDRLLTMLKLHEKRHERLRKERDSLEPHESYSLTVDYMKRSEHDTRMAEIEEEMSEYLALADTLVGEDGLLDANNPFVKRALDYIKGKALDLAERGEMYVLAKRWRDQLDQRVKAATLSDEQRETATKRLEVFNSIVKDLDER